MINGYYIRKCAKEVKISIPTSFYLRHKILDAIRTFMGIGSVGGVLKLMRRSLESPSRETIRRTLRLQCHEKSIKEALKVVLAVKMKREKEVSRRNKSAFCVLWIGQETLLLNLYVLV